MKDLKQRLNSFITQSIRVWRILKKPSSEEFKTISKVSAVGLLALGAVGFIISVIFKTFI